MNKEQTAKGAMVAAASQLSIIEVGGKTYLGVQGDGQITSALDIRGGFSTRKWIASEMSEENKTLTVGNGNQIISQPLTVDQVATLEHELFQYGRAEDSAFQELVNNAFFDRTNR